MRTVTPPAAMAAPAAPLVAAPLVAALLVAAGLLLAGCASDAPVEVGPTGDTTIEAVDLVVGTCILDQSSASTVTSVESVDCAVPHDAEVFASILLADGAFPGADAVAKAGVDQCATQFAAFVGVPFPASALTYEYYAPSAQTWAAGDRELLCLVRDPAGPVTGTLEDAAR